MNTQITENTYREYPLSRNVRLKNTTLERIRTRVKRRESVDDIVTRMLDQLESYENERGAS